MLQRLIAYRDLVLECAKSLWRAKYPDHARTDHVDLAAVEEPAFDETVEPIWEQLGAIGRSVPDSAWDVVPTDLSVRIDEVVYGGGAGRS